MQISEKLFMNNHSNNISLEITSGLLVSSEWVCVYVCGYAWARLCACAGAFNESSLVCLLNGMCIFVFVSLV